MKKMVQFGLVVMTLLCAVLIACASGPKEINGIPVSKSGDFEYQKIEFKMASDGSKQKGIQIESYTGKSEEVAIPEKINGQNVIVIGNSNKSQNRLPVFQNIKKIGIPDTVISIWAVAFQGNNLTEVTLPPNLDYLNGFNMNPISSITIPESVTKIGYYAFAGCQLTDIVIPKNVKTIEQRAFMQNKLTSLTIPASVTKIENEAFINNQITEITIEDGGTELSFGSNVFAGNPINLADIIIPDSIRKIKDDMFEMTIQGQGKERTITLTGLLKKADKNNVNWNEVVIPETLYGMQVTGLGKGLFKFGYNIGKLSLPASLKTIDPDTCGIAPDGIKYTLVSSIEAPNDKVKALWDTYYAGLKERKSSQYEEHMQGLNRMLQLIENFDKSLNK
ncbi:MAG: leucine-rich repeat domain-containing protein [Spirochaetaceae bacterium]|jgi:hypothetical protein|nr:leucine-rich repeat domain-containing protein [Spirochaetaceae bacterium]